MLYTGELVIVVVGAVLIPLVIAGVGATYVLGLGQQATDQTPRASFTFEYDIVHENPDGEDWGILTVAYDCGDRMPAIELYVRGSGFYAAVDRERDVSAIAAPVDQIREGRWNGSASFEDEDVRGPLVGDGDEARVLVNASHRIRVYWQHNYARRSAIRGEFAGASTGVSQASAKLAVHGGPDTDWPSEEDRPKETPAC